MSNNTSTFHIVVSSSILYRSACRFMNNELKAFNINAFEQSFLLILHNENASMTQQKIASKRGCSKATVTKSIQSLIKKGYVVACVSKIDKREKNVSLTDEGAGIISHILEAQEKHRELMFEGVDENIIGLTRNTMSLMATKALNNLNYLPLDDKDDINHNDLI